MRSGFAATLTLAVLTGACASTGGTPHPFPVPGGRAKSSPPMVVPPPTGTTTATQNDPAATSASSGGSTSDYDLVGTALQLRGIPYKNGGSDRSGFDCSGFTQYVFAQYGLALPRDVRSQFKTGAPIEWRELQPGDLIFFSTTDPGASHVGIAVGGDSFVHAPSSSGVVRVERFSSSYWAPRFVGGRRVLTH